ncbi:Qnr family pentapeptide repeat protein [Psychromonas sp. CD1]|uniref:Qnr family pentapeptide repeat protein n=1 Tax=Psychromonas sp. CD1 TaxID=1979839 RepID=UPI000B9B244D|nr:Qnr family pentapeptide repeat protein [Psychromonas sp. CD1]
MLYRNETFKNVSFIDQDLEAKRYEYCHFYGCDFSHANLRDTQFIHCKFLESGSDHGCKFEYSDLRDASFKDCQISMANFYGANCFAIEFRNCDLKGANFLKTSFVNHISQNAYFCSAYITGCNLSYANFTHQCMEKCDLFENRWIGANLQGASFKGSNLSRSEFAADSWGLFNLQDCDIRYSDLYSLDLRRVNLSGVKICAWQQEQLLSPLGLIIYPD